VVVNRDDACVYYVVGVTSFGSNYCGYQQQGVYTTVQRYLDWIESVVWASDVKDYKSGIQKPKRPQEEPKLSSSKNLTDFLFPYMKSTTISHHADIKTTKREMLILLGDSTQPLTTSIASTTLSTVPSSTIATSTRPHDTLISFLTKATAPTVLGSSVSTTMTTNNVHHLTHNNQTTTTTAIIPTSTASLNVSTVSSEKSSIRETRITTGKTLETNSPIIKETTTTIVTKIKAITTTSHSQTQNIHENSSKNESTERIHQDAFDSLSSQIESPLLLPHGTEELVSDIYNSTNVSHVLSIFENI